MESRSESAPDGSARTGREGLRVVLAGGGTGGHLFPGLAVAEELRSRDPEAQLLFLGARGGIEERILPRSGWEFIALNAPRGSRGLLATALRLPLIAFHLWRATRAARRVLEEFDAEVVVGLGGYASLPAARAAGALRLPVVLLEQNTHPGRPNRFLVRGGRVAAVLATFAESRRRFARPDIVEGVGNPVRRETLAACAPERREGAFDRLRLLVAGGSQGAQRLNEILCGALPLIAAREKRVSIMHLTGSEEGAQESRARMAGAGLAGEARAWSDRMGELYAGADLVVARAGATSLAELAAAGLPAILVPYPFAADDHQTANAAVFVAAGAAESIAQDGLTPELLAARVLGLLADPERLRRMSAAARSLARPAAAAEVAERVVGLARAGRAQ